MIAIWAVLFFLVSAAVVWLLLFDEARERVFDQAAHIGRMFWRRFQGLWSKLSGRTASRVRDGGSHIARTLGAHRYLLVGAISLLLLPMLSILLLRQNVALEGFNVAQRQHASTLIQELLRGERLVPPPPPPPEVFLTQEVEMVRPMTATADRKWERLDDEFTQVMLAVYTVMKEEYGYDMVLVEGYRSPERQSQLAAQGEHVTLAQAGQSWHQYGLAADSAFMRDGKLVISEQDPWAMRGYQLYGQVAKEAGLVWGGDWKSIKDLMHVELRRPGVKRKARTSTPDQ